MLEKRIKQLKQRLRLRVEGTNKHLYEINSILRTMIEDNEELVNLSEVYIIWKKKCSKN